MRLIEIIKNQKYNNEFIESNPRTVENQANINRGSTIRRCIPNTRVSTFISAIFVALVLLLSNMQLAYAQTIFHVRADATGANNGKDWNNAFKALPSELVRGATYYVADGNYSGFTFATPESGSSSVTIRKATSSEHGSSIGWLSSFGDAQAQFGPIKLSAGYLVFDGAVGGGPGKWKSGHGFKLYSSGYNVLLTFSKSVSGVSIRHTEFAFPSTEVDDTLSADHIYGALSIKNFVLEYCYLHDSTRTFILSRGWVDVLIQNNCFARNRSTSGRHAEAWSDHNGVRYTIRNNIWEDIEGTGCVVLLTGNGYDWDIYGNVIYWTGKPSYTGFGNGAFTTRSSLAYAYNWKVYNNTVANGKGNTFHMIYNGSGNYVKNNLWYNSPVTPSGAALVDFNWYISSGTKTKGQNDVSDPTGQNPILDIVNLDFRLKVKSPQGANVDEPGKDFDIDPLGVRRLTWTRGAYEGGSGVLPSTTTIPAPTRLRLSP